MAGLFHYMLLFALTVRMVPADDTMENFVQEMIPYHVMVAEDVFNEANELFDQIFFFELKLGQSELAPFLQQPYLQSLSELREQLRRVRRMMKPYFKGDINQIPRSLVGDSLSLVQDCGEQLEALKAEFLMDSTLNDAGMFIRNPQSHRGNYGRKIRSTDGEDAHVTFDIGGDNLGQSDEELEAILDSMESGEE